MNPAAIASIIQHLVAHFPYIYGLVIASFLRINKYTATYSSEFKKRIFGEINTEQIAWVPFNEPCSFYEMLKWGIDECERMSTEEIAMIGIRANHELQTFSIHHEHWDPICGLALALLRKENFELARAYAKTALIPIQQLYRVNARLGYYGNIKHILTEGSIFIEVHTGKKFEDDYIVENDEISFILETYDSTYNRLMHLKAALIPEHFKDEARKYIHQQYRK